MSGNMVVEKKNCGGTSNWLDLDLIYERTLFLFISVSPSLSLSGCSPSLASYLIVHTHEQHKIRNMRAHMQTGKMHTPQPAILLQKVNNDLLCDFLRGHNGL